MHTCRSRFLDLSQGCGLRCPPRSESQRMIGQSISHYRGVEKLDDGTGVVYEAKTPGSSATSPWSFLRKGFPRPPARIEQVLDLGAQIADALDAAHAMVKSVGRKLTSFTYGKLSSQSLRAIALLLLSCVAVRSGEQCVA